MELRVEFRFAFSCVSFSFFYCTWYRLLSFWQNSMPTRWTHRYNHCHNVIFLLPTICSRALKVGSARLRPFCGCMCLASALVVHRQCSCSVFCFFLPGPIAYREAGSLAKRKKEWHGETQWRAFCSARTILTIFTRSTFIYFSLPPSPVGFGAPKMWTLETCANHFEKTFRRKYIFLALFCIFKSNQILLWKQNCSPCTETKTQK